MEEALVVKMKGFSMYCVGGTREQGQRREVGENYDKGALCMCGGCQKKLKTSIDSVSRRSCLLWKVFLLVETFPPRKETHKASETQDPSGHSGNS